MPEDNIPLVLAVADSLATPGNLTDSQREEALQAIESFRALSPRFLESAEQILGVGGETSNAELFSVTTQGARASVALSKILKALWILEDGVFQRRNDEIAVMGKEASQ